MTETFLSSPLLSNRVSQVYKSITGLSDAKEKNREKKQKECRTRDNAVQCLKD